MQATAIGTVVNSLPENEANPPIPLISKRHIPHTDLLKEIRDLQNESTQKTPPCGAWSAVAAAKPRWGRAGHPYRPTILSLSRRHEHTAPHAASMPPSSIASCGAIGP